MSDTILKPCPFCGGEAVALTGPVKTLFGVSCLRCSCWLDERAPTAAAAIAAWNTRTEAPGPRDEVIQRLVDALEPLAVMAERYDPDEGDDGNLECWSGLAVPKIHHLRDARAALAFAKEQLK